LVTAQATKTQFGERLPFATTKSKENTKARKWGVAKSSLVVLYRSALWGGIHGRVGERKGERKAREKRETAKGQRKKRCEAGERGDTSWLSTSPGR
jgi:hypothetical protein